MGLLGAVIALSGHPLYLWHLSLTEAWGLSPRALGSGTGPDGLMSNGPKKRWQPRNAGKRTAADKDTLLTSSYPRLAVRTFFDAADQDTLVRSSGPAVSSDPLVHGFQKHFSASAEQLTV